jgi:hypothetical protein
MEKIIEKCKKYPCYIFDAENDLFYSIDIKARNCSEAQLIANTIIAFAHSLQAVVYDKDVEE